MNTNTNRIKQWQEQEALSRFQLIAPLLQEDLDDAKRLQLRKQIAQDNDISVRSIYRYEKAYREGQFAGLKPAAREKRRSQKLLVFFASTFSSKMQIEFLKVAWGISPVLHFLRRHSFGCRRGAVAGIQSLLVTDM